MPPKHPSFSPSITSWLSTKTQTGIRRFLGYIASKSWDHPCYFIFGGVLLTIIGSLGLLRFTEYNDGSIPFWTPRNSNIYDEYEQQIDYFGDYPLKSYVLVKKASVSDQNGDNLDSSNEKNIMTPDTLDAAYKLFNYAITNISTRHKGESWSFDELCKRPFPSYDNCTSQLSNIFLFWAYEPTFWSDQDWIDLQMAQYSNRFVCLFFV